MTNATSHPSTFSQWLKRLRTQHDLTQEALAELAFCSVQTIRAFESGKRRASLEMAERLVDVLQVADEQRASFIRLARAVLVAPVEESAPTATSTTAPPLSLLSVATPLIGRAAEIDTLSHLLWQEKQRLVTIVGPGGMGKTRLALDLTARLHPNFTDGAGFVALAAVTQVQHLASTIASSLNIPVQGATDLQQQVNAWLAPRHLLLTLDNFEQLLAQAEIVEWLRQLLMAAPKLQLLVTSRERLRVSGERIFELGGLPLPDPNRPLEEADAALLFLERAQQVAGDLMLNAHNHAAVSHICHLVEGMPLGIELAAAWVHVLTPNEIADEISRSIDFLARSDRDMTPRHRSMRAVFDHSWQLLREEERQVLMKLSVFRGGCTREAAQQVTEATLPVLASLIDKSLLRKTQTTTTRYMIHELVRQYAYQKLNEASEADIVQHKHLRQMISFAKLNAEQLGKATHKEAIIRLTDEHDNLRIALQWSLEHAQCDEGLQLAQACSPFWRLTGYSSEGLHWFAQLFAQRSLIRDPSLLAQALFRAGELAWSIHDSDNTSVYYEESLRLSQQQGDRLREADLYEGMAAIALDHAQAQCLSEQALAIYRELGQARGMAFSTMHLAILASGAGDHPQAMRFYEECLLYFRKQGDLMVAGDAVRGLAISHYRLHQYDEAARLYREAMTIFQTMGHERGIYMVQTDLGDIALVCGNVNEAESYYGAALIGAWKFEDKYMIAWGFENLARTALARGQLERALQLFAAASTYFLTIRARLRPDDQTEREALIAQARSGVDSHLFARAWAIGEAMSVQQAYQIALGELQNNRSSDTTG